MLNEPRNAAGKFPFPNRRDRQSALLCRTIPEFSQSERSWLRHYSVAHPPSRYSYKTYNVIGTTCGCQGKQRPSGSRSSISQSNSQGLGAGKQCPPGGPATMPSPVMRIPRSRFMIITIRPREKLVIGWGWALTGVSLTVWGNHSGGTTSSRRFSHY